MTALADLVEPLKRELAVPGQFASIFPGTQDGDLTASLADGFAEAQLQGFFGTLTLVNGTETSDELSAAGGALVILFTGMRIIRAQLRSTLTMEKYDAKTGTGFEIQRSANLLRDELAFMNNRLSQLIIDARRSQAPLAVMLDNYTARVGQQFRDKYWAYGYGELMNGALDVGGFFPYEWK